MKLIGPPSAWYGWTFLGFVLGVVICGLLLATGAIPAHGEERGPCTLVAAGPSRPALIPDAPQTFVWARRSDGICYVADMPVLGAKDTAYVGMTLTEEAIGTPSFSGVNGKPLLPMTYDFGTLEPLPRIPARTVREIGTLTPIEAWCAGWNDAAAQVWRGRQDIRSKPPFNDLRASEQLTDKLLAVTMELVDRLMLVYPVYGLQGQDASAQLCPATPAFRKLNADVLMATDPAGRRKP